MTANSSCDWPSRSALGADADHTEMHALNQYRLFQRIDVRAEQPLGGLRAKHGHRPADRHFSRAHQPPTFGIVARKIDVLLRHTRDADAVDRHRAIRQPRVGARPEHYSRYERAVALDGVGIARRDERVRLHLEPLFVAAHDPELLNDEGIGAGLVQDRRADRGIEPLNQRDDGDDRRDRDDVAEHRHQRPELGRPDGA